MPCRPWPLKDTCSPASSSRRLRPPEPTTTLHGHHHGAQTSSGHKPALGTSVAMTPPVFDVPDLSHVPAHPWGPHMGLP